MADYEEFLVADLQTAKYIGKDRWLSPSDAFPTLLNAEVEQGVLKRRRGSQEFTRGGALTGWIERFPSNIAPIRYNPIACDSDGSNIIAGLCSRLYISSNTGSSWTEKQPAGNVDKPWSCVASDSDGSNLIAGVSQGRIYTSADSGATWTERKPAGDRDMYWMAVASSADGAVLYAAAHLVGTGYTSYWWVELGLGFGPIANYVYKSTDSGVTWTAVLPNNDMNQSWESIACDSDGSVVILGSKTSLYLSTDSGATWTEKEPVTGVNHYWIGVACDSDGSVLMAAVSGGRLYVSTNTGTSWTEKKPNGDVAQSYKGVACNTDGTILMAAITTGNFYTSIDSGATWTEKECDAQWYALACDSDGTVMLATVNYSGRVYISTNSGSTFTEAHPAGDTQKYWLPIAMDSDGSNLIAGIDDGRLYTSANGGATWTERQPGGDADKLWYAVASDSDGSFLVAAASGGRLYTSADSGATWTERQPAGAANKAWVAVACDSDGSNIIAAVSNGRLYTSSDSGANWTERQPLGDANQTWISVASDSDGSNLIVAKRGTSGANINGYIFTSADSGVNWTERTPGSLGNLDIDWYEVASDSDGSVLVAVRHDTNSNIYVSVDSGATWTARTPGTANDTQYNCCACDADGSVIMVGHQNSYLGGRRGRIFISRDTGATWTEETPAQDEDQYWGGLAMDSTGTNLLACSGQATPAIVGRLYGYTYALPIVGFGKITHQGYNEIVVCDTRRMFQLHEDGSITWITPTTQFTGDEDDYFWFQEYRAALYFVNGVDGIHIYTPNQTLGTAVAAMNTGAVTIQTCAMLFTYKNRLIMVSPKIGGVWYPEYIYFTDVNLDNVGASNLVKAQADITPMGGGYIGEVPVIFCSDGSIWHITYTHNTDAPFTWEKRTAYFGNYARMGIAELKGKLAALGINRMLTYDGYQATEMTDKIRGIHGQISDTKIVNTFAHRFRDRNWIGWSYTRAGETDHDRILLYNIEDDNFAESDIGANCLFSLKGPWLPKATQPGNFHFPIRDQDYVEYEFAGTKDGRILQINTGYQDEGVNIVSDIRSSQFNPFQKEGFQVKIGWVKFLLFAPKGEGISVSFYKDDSATAFKTVQIDSPGAIKTWQTAWLDGEVGDFFTMKIIHTYESGVNATDEFIQFAIMIGMKRAGHIRNRYEYSV